jgi:hypothetical protein
VASPDVDPLIYLTGRPTPVDFVQFVKIRAVDGEQQDDEQLAIEWDSARQHIRSLISAEGDFADNPALTPLPEEMVAAATAALENSSYQHSRRYLQEQWYIVEIDRLVVYQKTINLRHVSAIKELLPPVLTPLDLIGLATGTVSPPPPVRTTRPTPNNYYFVSKSLDLRFLGVVSLDPEMVRGYRLLGQPSHVIGVFVGFGFNPIKAFHINNRLILANGSHRLYALREAGVTHVPCLISQITTKEQQALIPAKIRGDEKHYLEDPRPPLFKDYFDTRLRKIIPTVPVAQLLNLQLSMDTQAIPST